jgi:hypothetical protein
LKKALISMSKENAPEILIYRKLIKALFRSGQLINTFDDFIFNQPILSACKSNACINNLV